MALILRDRSSAELRERFAQFLATRAERHGIGSALRLTDTSLRRVLAPAAARDPTRLLAAFRNVDGRPRFFAGPSEAAATASAVRARAPDHAAATVSRAHRVLSGRFDLLGYEGLDFGAPIDWQLDPVAGRRAPLVHWSRVPYLNDEVVGDHKVVWELNRQQYLVTLGQAYAYTGDERWAEGAVGLMEQWLDANPPKLGINWASSLEVAFRAMSWLWALHLLRASPALTPALYSRLLGALHVHARHLERYLSTYFSPNTHLTGEALGLFQIGLLLPELKGAPRWRARGRAILESWLPRHVRPDGVYFEQASQYHRYTTEFYAHYLLLAESNGLEVGSHVRPTLDRLYDHLLHITRPDGTIPLLGDDDGGRLVQLDDALPADVRSTFAVGAALTGRGDLAFGTRGDVAAAGWLLGAPGLARLDGVMPAPPTTQSRAFPDGGFYVSRSDWSADADWSVLDCGPHGTMNCGHAHADALALVLSAGGRPLLVDSGTYNYPGEERNSFRDGAAHNTVTVDGVSSSEPGTAFQWRSVAGCNVEHWISEPTFDFVAGSHDGFTRLADPAVHRREVLYLRGEYWVVRDMVESHGEHDVAVHWHAAPDLVIRPGPEGARDLCASDEPGRPLLRLAVAADGGSWTVEAGWVSPTYGRREPSEVAVYRCSGSGSQEIVTAVLPARGGEGPSSILPLAAVRDGRGFRVSHLAGYVDWLLLGAGGVLNCEDVRTDAGWLWLRRDAGGRVTRWLALHGTYAVVGEQELFRSAVLLPWAGSGTPSGAPAQSEMGVS